MHELCSPIGCLEFFFIMDRSASLQCNLVFTTVVVFGMRVIRSGFKMCIPWKFTCSFIASMFAMAGNIYKFSASSSMQEFVIMKIFSTQIHPSSPKCLKEILWSPPHLGWIKVNIGRASCGTPLRETYDGMFRNNLGEHLDSFACKLPPNNELYA